MHQQQNREIAPTPNNANRLTDPPPAQMKSRTGTTSSATDAMVVSIPPGNELLALQIQAFLRASQDEELDGELELDEEVVQDILSVLSTPGSGGVVHGQVDVMGEDDDDSDSDDTSDLIQDSLKGQLSLLLLLLLETEH